MRLLTLLSITGWWFVVETVGHRQEDRFNRHGYVNLTVCPRISIFLKNEHRIYMVWEEPKGRVSYNFEAQSKEDPGYWWSVGQQNGTYVTNPRLNYKQFAGSVQVLKAVSSHLVLRFCSLGDHHYTIVMARHRNVTQDTINELNKHIIEARGLPLWDIRRACVDGAQSVLATSILICLASSLALFMFGVF